MDRVDLSPWKRMLVFAIAYSAVASLLLIVMFVTAIPNYNKQVQCAAENVQLQRAVAEAKISAITWEMNAKEIEQERHEMEMAWKASQSNLNLAKKVIRDFTDKKQRELDEQLPEEIVKPRRATGAILPGE